MALKAPRVDFVKSETNVFAEPGYTLGIENTTQHEYFSQTKISTTTPATFFVQGNDLQYIDLSKTKLALLCKLTQKDGTNIANHATATTRIYLPVNNILGSIFEKVSVHLNGTEVTQKSNLYPFASYFENLLSFGREYKKSQAEASGFYRCENEDDDSDNSFTTRQKLADASSVFELVGRPNVHIFQQERLLLPGIDMKVTLHQAPHDFCLISKGTNKVDVVLQIVECRLILTKHEMIKSLQAAHLKTWMDYPLVYPTKEGIMKTFSMPTGTVQEQNETLINGLLPYRLVIGILPTASMHGKFDKNPFNFVVSTLKELVVTVNGEHRSQKIFKVDDSKTKPSLLENYYSLFEGLEVSNCDPSIDISFKEWKKGKALFAVNLQETMDGLALPRHGNVTIQLKFSSATTESLSVLVYGEYPSTMYIRNDKQVYFKDYASEY